MARSRGGDGGLRRRRRRTSSRPISTESVDDYFHVGYSEGNSLSSDCDAIGYNRRDKVLDDALFGFFREQAVNSLKRNFSDFCKDFPGTNLVNKNKIDGVDKSVFTSFGLKYYLQVLKKLTSEQRAIIQNFGFGCLLLFDCCNIPSAFARWVADCIDPFCSQITVGGKSFDVSKETFHIVLGLPIGGLQIPCNSDDGRAFILSHFQLSDLPHITFFGNKLSSHEPLSDLDVFFCFMTIAISCYLCPELNNSVNSKYLAVLKDPAVAKCYDFSKLVHEHCLHGMLEFSSFGKFRGTKLKAPVCCNYVPMGLGCSYASLKPSSPLAVSPMSSEFRISAHAQFASSLQADVIDGIVSIADKFVSRKSTSNKPKMDLLVTNVLDFLCKFSFIQKKVDSKLSVPDGKSTVHIDKQQHIMVSDANMHYHPCTVETEELVQKASPAPHDAVKDFSSGPIGKTDPATPDCMITKVVERYTLMTAPALNPIKKVKARRCHVLSEEEQENIMSQRLCGATSSEIMGIGTAVRNKRIVEPIKGLIDLSDDGCGILRESMSKKPQTGNYKLKRLHLVQKIGSIQAPIKIEDVSPKPSMNGNREGVHIVGSNDFRRRCSELSKKTDNTYNNMMLSNQQGGNGMSVAQDNVQNVAAQETNNHVQNVLNCPVRQKYRFVNWLVTGQTPPLQLNSRYPVSEIDIIHYSAIIELAHSSHKKTLGVLYQKVHCSYQSLGESFMPNGEVDNFLILCFCHVLFEERHPSSSGRHYFFPHIGESILKYAGEHQESTIRASFEGAAKASKGRNLGASDNRLFFPIVDSGHWFTFVVDFEYKMFAFLDSFYDKESDFHLRMKDRLIDNFVHLWELIISEQHNFGFFRAMYPHVSKQQTLKDCGVFTMKFMEDWKPFIDMRTVFSYHDILNLRILYANRLYFFIQNEADLSFVTDFYAVG